jgi:hypothetical protein
MAGRIRLVDDLHPLLDRVKGEALPVKLVALLGGETVAVAWLPLSQSICLPLMTRKFILGHSFFVGVSDSVFFSVIKLHFISFLFLIFLFALRTLCSTLNWVISFGTLVLSSHVSIARLL